ncbi:hypothetical protein ACFVU3_21765 [Streptomyces sp. NPDC058052]|uniref:hypothetical protein n=1 Tax=Streptomyces sp. NPDC058052 TaxID=3346316 RepID=UPI0036ECC246
MSATFVELGNVSAPSGVLVLGTAGHIGSWRELGRPLSERAEEAAAGGGGHVREWLCEAVAVPAATDRPVRVRASTSPSPFDGEPAIATLEIDLGIPWPRMADPDAPVRLGDLPVDRCGMVVGDARGLDAWRSDHHLRRSGWCRPLRAGVIDVEGCRVLGIGWDQGDHSMRHRGERAAGQVYPVTLEADATGRTVLRWSIPPYGHEPA